jgi:predicted transposase YbfD/YdcC
MSTEHAQMLSIASRSGEQSMPIEQSLRQLDELLRAHISEENVLFWYLDVHDRPGD